MTLQFHIDNNDYFGTLATRLDIIRQTKDLTPLEDIIKELIYLQDNYLIIKK